MPIVVLNVIGASGYLYFTSVVAVGNAIAYIPAGLAVGPDDFTAGAAIYVAASISLFVGALVASIEGSRRRVANPSAKPVWSAVEPYAARHWPSVLILSTLPLVLGVLAVGPAETFYRGDYLALVGPNWMAELSDGTIPLALGSIGMVLFGRFHRVGRASAALLVLAYAIFLLAKDTRMLSLLPLILFATFLVQRGRRTRLRNIIAGALTSALTALLLYQLVLTLRGLPVAGLVPYLDAIFRDPVASVSSGGGLHGFLASVLFSLPYAGALARHVSSLPPSTLVTSLTPLPSGLTDWQSLEPWLRFNIFSPYSSLAELAILGSGVLVCYFFVVGFLATALQRAAQRLGGVRPRILHLGLMALFVLFAVTILQYNLRTSTRLMWYALGLYAVMRVLPRSAATSVVRAQRYPRPRGLGAATHDSGEAHGSGQDRRELTHSVMPHIAS